MNCYKAIILLLLFPKGIIAQENQEQIAFDFFIENIMFEKYGNEKSIYFSSAIENITSVNRIFSKCFRNDKTFGEFRFDYPPLTENKIDVRISTKSKIKLSKKPRSRNLNLKIYKAVRQGENFYVSVSVYKRNHFVDHFLIKIIENTVIDYCFVNEII